MLPPKSPELNPVENLWHYLRSHYWSNRLYTTWEDLKQPPPTPGAVCLVPELVKSICADTAVRRIKDNPYRLVPYAPDARGTRSPPLHEPRSPTVGEALMSELNPQPATAPSPASEFAPTTPPVLHNSTEFDTFFDPPTAPNVPPPTPSSPHPPTSVSLPPPAHRHFPPHLRRDDLLRRRHPRRPPHHPPQLEARPRLRRRTGPPPPRTHPRRRRPPPRPHAPIHPPRPPKPARQGRGAPPPQRLPPPDHPPPLPHRPHHPRPRPHAHR